MDLLESVSGIKGQVRGGRCAQKTMLVTSRKSSLQNRQLHLEPNAVCLSVGLQALEPYLLMVIAHHIALREPPSRVTCSFPLVSDPSVVSVSGEVEMVIPGTPPPAGKGDGKCRSDSKPAFEALRPGCRVVRSAGALVVSITSQQSQKNRTAVVGPNDRLF